MSLTPRWLPRLRLLNVTLPPAIRGRSRAIDRRQIPKRPIASPILRASVTTSRPASSTARTDRLTAGRNKCTTNASVISAAAGVTSRDGCPAMVSSVSFAAAAPMMVSPTAVGLDRTLRTCARGAAPARRIADPNAAITISVTRFESALEIPYTAVVMRWRNSFSRLDTMIASPHSRRGRLRCSRRTGGVDWVAGVPNARSVRLGLKSTVWRPQSLWATAGAHSDPRSVPRLVHAPHTFNIVANPDALCCRALVALNASPVNRSG